MSAAPRFIRTRTSMQAVLVLSEVKSARAHAYASWRQGRVLVRMHSLHAHMHSSACIQAQASL
eukprot:55055-Pleurochrysis_carterae.AAC.1